MNWIYLLENKIELTPQWSEVLSCRLVIAWGYKLSLEYLQLPTADWFLILERPALKLFKFYFRRIFFVLSKNALIFFCTSGLNFKNMMTSILVAKHITCKIYTTTKSTTPLMSVWRKLFQIMKVVRILLLIAWCTALACSNATVAVMVSSLMQKADCDLRDDESSTIDCPYCESVLPCRVRQVYPYN